MRRTIPQEAERVLDRVADLSCNILNMLQSELADNGEILAVLAACIVLVNKRDKIPGAEKFIEDCRLLMIGCVDGIARRKPV
jgi:hypothetical protein